ncbi:hypothetical protein AWC38_SpisGene10619 [Stylophora pistillata]|uniref:Reverse transcriptase domain-containing protein n=1 Tax=Stylophora pistillata TaxID=50429 RepID=A0A2B4S8B7_STYPI|nr:hypothetical protein AWC38_SpisGene10619 [Stylophora pistillata]
MASQFASVTSEEITQINDEADPENTKKATKFGLAVFKANSLVFYQSVPWKMRSLKSAAFKEAHACLERNTSRQRGAVLATKNHQGGLNDKEDESNGEVLEIPGSKRCQVKLIGKYLSRLNPECSSLFQKPRSPCKSFKPARDAVWYCSTPLGHNTLDMLHFMTTRADFISAYRKLHSCETSFLRLTEDWKMIRDRGELVAVVSMDLSKAFDVIQYPLLLSKLKAYGMDDKSGALLRDYLSVCDTVTTDEDSGSEEDDYGDTEEERNEVDVEPEEPCVHRCLLHCQAPCWIDCRTQPFVTGFALDVIEAHKHVNIVKEQLKVMH